MTALATPGRGWAYTGAILGGAVSIAANVAHSFIPPHNAPATWTPEPGAVVGAIVWPVFLFIAVEILARVLWPRGGGWQLMRWGGLLPVTVVAAFVSYRHLSGLLAHYGEEPIVYLLGPLAVDGLMVMATGALMATGRQRSTETATTTTPVPVTAAASPSINASALANAPSPVDTPHAPAAPAPVPVNPPAPLEVPTPAVVAERIAPRRTTAQAAPAAVPEHGTRTPRPRPGRPVSRPADKPAPSTPDSPVTASDAAQLTLPVVAPDLLNRANTAAAQYLAEHGTPITAGQLAVRLKVTSDQATQALAQLDHNNAHPTVNHSPVSGSLR